METSKKVLSDILRAVEENEDDLNNIPIEPLKNVINKGLKSLPSIELYTELMDQGTPFDEIEVHGVRDIYKDVKDAEEGTCFEQCEDSEAEMWSVYIHIPDNGLECIADCETKELAEALRGMLLIAGKLFIRN